MIPRSVTTERIECDLGAPFISLNELVVHRLSGRGYTSRQTDDVLLTASQYRRCSDERQITPLEIRIQAV
jgi:hypothetical protein